MDLTSIPELVARDGEDLKSLADILLVQRDKPFVARLAVRQASVGGHVNDKGNSTLKCTEVHNLERQNNGGRTVWT